jgi:hypothetical protein
MAAYGQPTGIKPKPEPDGTHFIKVRSPNGEEFEVPFSRENVRQFVQTFQEGLVDQWPGTEPIPQFPILTLNRIGAGHGSGTIELLGSTDQIGYAILIASDELLRQAKHAIERTLEMRASRKTMM